VHPVLCSLVIGGLVWLFISTLLQTLETVKQTVTVCKQINQHEFLKRVGRLSLFLSMYYFRSAGWPFLIGMTLGKEIPKYFISRSIEKRLALAVEEFILLSIIEYLFRSSIVVAAFYIATGT